MRKFIYHLETAAMAVFVIYGVFHVDEISAAIGRFFDVIMNIIIR